LPNVLYTVQEYLQAAL